MRILEQFKVATCSTVWVEVTDINFNLLILIVVSYEDNSEIGS